MPRDAIATCPICAGELAVTRLHCGSCGTTIEGEFAVGRFARLPREQFGLLESFLRSRGNLKDLERELGVSYPTVRARIDQLLRLLGLADDAGSAEGTSTSSEEVRPADDAVAPAAPDRAAQPDPAAARRAVLERLSRHEIDAAAAAAELRTLGG
jgi:hypothetical protein